MSTVRFEWVGELPLRDLPQQLSFAQRRLLSRAALEAERQMKLDAPKATTLLANSIGHSLLSDTEASVGPAVRYAPWVLHGRSAGKRPPFQAIYDWVRRRALGGNNPRQAAFLIARAIGRRGVRGQDFIGPTARLMEQRLPLIAEAVLRELTP